METLFIGKKIIRLSQVDSTNNYANQLLRQSVINEGDIVITEHQTAGKGQRGNVWMAEKGKNLTFSILLKPTFLKVSEQFYLTKAISLAIVSTLKTFLTHQVEIKWPNDIYVGDRKIAGILIENSLEGSKMNTSIIGIGLNINQVNFSVVHKATSMALVLGKEQDKDEVLKLLLFSVEQFYIKLRKNVKIFDAEYLSVLKGKDEKLIFLINNVQKEGIIRNVTTEGRLVVEIEGETNEFNLKEIIYL